MTHLGFHPIAASQRPPMLPQSIGAGPGEASDAPARDATPWAPRAGAANPLVTALRAAGHTDHDIARLLALSPVVDVSDAAVDVLRAIGWAQQTLAQVHGIEVAA